MIDMIDPTQGAVVGGGGLAPRLTSLTGARFGFFSNGKLNAHTLLERLRDELTAHGPLGAEVWGTYHVGKAMADDEWTGLERCDAVVLAIGDCGSCSSSGLLNAIQLERRGTPTALLATAPFTDALITMRDMLGMPAMHWVTLEHPIGSLSDEEVAARAKSALAEVVDILVGPEAADGE